MSTIKRRLQALEDGQHYGGERATLDGRDIMPATTWRELLAHIALHGKCVVNLQAL